MPPANTSATNKIRITTGSMRVCLAIPAQTPATTLFERSRRSGGVALDCADVTRRSSQSRRVSPMANRVAPQIRAAIGPRTAKRKCRVPVASRSSTTPKAAMSAPATSAPMSSRLAIGACPVHALEADAGLDAELTDADVGVNRQLRLPGRRVMNVLPIVARPAGRAIEDLRLPRGDVGRARHAHVRRHEHFRLTDAELQVHMTTAGAELRVA